MKKIIYSNQHNFLFVQENISIREDSEMKFNAPKLE